MSSPAGRPDISVVIATRNRADQLEQTLASYRAQEIEGFDWELIVVDNASDDATADVIAAAAEDLPLVALYAAEPGKNRADNEALPHIRGALVVFADDDTIAAPDCLTAYRDAAARWPDDAIFGARVTPRFPADTPAWLASPKLDFGTTAFARYEPADREGPVTRHPYGPSFMVRASALGEHRFPEHLGPQGAGYAMGGEAAFLRQLAADGHRYIYVPSARVEHVVRAEQIEEEWLVHRAHNKGRGQVYLPSTKKPRRLFIGGVSLKLWLSTGRAWLRYALARLGRDRQRRAHYGVQWALRAGELEERRRLHRQSNEQAG